MLRRSTTNHARRSSPPLDSVNAILSSFGLTLRNLKLFLYLDSGQSGTGSISHRLAGLDLSLVGHLFNLCVHKPSCNGSGKKTQNCECFRSLTTPEALSLKWSKQRRFDGVCIVIGSWAFPPWAHYCKERQIRTLSRFSGH